MILFNSRRSYTVRLAEARRADNSDTEDSREKRARGQAIVDFWNIENQPNFKPSKIPYFDIIWAFTLIGVFLAIFQAVCCGVCWLFSGSFF